MPKIYIAGPMTGIKDWNFPAFFAAEKELEALGYEVINPAHNDGATVQEALESAGSPEAPNNPWRWYMKRDLPHVLSCDMICLLPGWQSSKGASLEVTVAKAIGLPLMVLKEGKLVPRLEIVGLSGWARSGKDTLAKRLIENHGYTRISFADAMREALYKLNPEIDVDGYDMKLATAVDLMGWEQLKEVSSGIRGLMQRMGTEVGREMFGEDFWVNLAMNRIPDGSKIVVADVRFKNEADAIKAAGGQVWRIVRDGVGPANDHISEIALDDYSFDAIVLNTGGIENLWGIADNLVLDK
jgi:hypothetical protein